MSNDTISNDPKLQEEARRATARAVAEANLPKPDFNPEAVAREEWAKRVDPKYAKLSFDETWPKLCTMFQDPPKPDDIRAVLTESEFRQAVSAILRGVNATNLRHWADEEESRARTHQASCTMAVEDRLGKIDMKGVLPDLLHGYMRANVNLTKRTCPFHPEGCPDDDGASITTIPLSVPGSSGLGQALAQALANALGVKKDPK